VASTDDLKLITTPLATVETSQAMKAIQDLIQGFECDGFVVGVPLLIGGGSTDSHPHIERFIQSLKKAFPDVPVHLVDEGNTSWEASAIQMTGGMKKSQRRQKGSLDPIAASLILRRHLDESG
jgi:putative Holliday junction resolvase